MLERLFPYSADNRYLGSAIALWILGFLGFIKTAMGVNSIFNGYEVATGADGIPLDSFGPAGSRAMVAMFAAWGVSQLVLSLLCIVVLVRYRTLTSALLTLLLLEHLGRRMVAYALPIERIAGAPGGMINLVLATLMILALGLSLRRARQPHRTD